MGSNPSKFKDAVSGDAGIPDNLPVEQVYWNDINADSTGFIAKLKVKAKSENSGQMFTFRLPTEAEWEYAARVGVEGQKYSGSNTIDGVAWYAYNSSGKTHQVGKKAYNA